MNVYYMHRKKIHIAILVLASLLCSIGLVSAQEASTDSLQTPFRKGRWLTGLSGSITSGSTSFDRLGKKTFTNQYGLEFVTGKFVKDRWLIGALFNAKRTNTEDVVKKEAESLFVGPSLTHFFMKERIGSVFLGLSVGYVRFVESTTELQNGGPVEDIVSGQGGGFLLSLGYAYVIQDRITFNFSLASNSIWVDANRQGLPGVEPIKETIGLSELSFSFGFNVLLDNFFF